MLRLSEKTGLYGTYSGKVYMSFAAYLKLTTDQAKMFITHAQLMETQTMEENKSTSTGSAPFGSTSTADQENRTQIRGELTNNLHIFAHGRGCPNPWSWAAAWASMCIGPSWKNWDMPSGNSTLTVSSPFVANMDSLRTHPGLGMQPPSSEPPAPTGEKTEKNDLSSAAFSGSFRRQILDAYWAAPAWSRQAALEDIKNRDPLAWNAVVFPYGAAGASPTPVETVTLIEELYSSLSESFKRSVRTRLAVDETSVPTSAEIFQTLTSEGSEKAVIKFSDSTSLEIYRSRDGTLAQYLRPAAQTGR